MTLKNKGVFFRFVAVVSRKKLSVELTLEGSVDLIIIINRLFFNNLKIITYIILILIYEMVSNIYSIFSSVFEQNNNRLIVKYSIFNPFNRGSFGINWHLQNIRIVF